MWPLTATPHLPLLEVLVRALFAGDPVWSTTMVMFGNLLRQDPELLHVRASLTGMLDTRLYFSSRANPRW